MNALELDIPDAGGRSLAKAMSAPVGRLGEIPRDAPQDRGRVVLQCPSTGWRSGLRPSSARIAGVRVHDRDAAVAASPWRRRQKPCSAAHSRLAARRRSRCACRAPRCGRARKNAASDEAHSRPSAARARANNASFDAAACGREGPRHQCRRQRGPSEPDLDVRQAAGDTGDVAAAGRDPAHRLSSAPREPGACLVPCEPHRVVSSRSPRAESGTRRHASSH